jgi:hypothetical protein
MIPDHISHHDYLRIDAISASLLKAMAHAPAKAKYFLEHPVKPTEEMALGTICHKVVFEPDKLAQDFELIEERLDWKTREGKAQKAMVQKMESEGRVVMFPVQLALARAMANSIRSNETAAELVADKGPCEVTILQELEFNGHPFKAKARLDKLTLDDWIVDLKTTKDASPWGFSREIKKYGYHIQGGWYKGLTEREGKKVKGVKFIAVEKEPPYLASVYELSARALQKGRQQVNYCLETYFECLKSGIWPGYTVGCQEIDLPEYCYYE